MSKEQAVQITNQLLSELRSKGGIQVTPESFDAIAQAIGVLQTEKPKEKK